MNAGHLAPAIVVTGASSGIGREFARLAIEDGVALVLAHGQYAIHGTNAPGSIGGFVSYGCIRMYNKDILDLYARVGVGTRVVVQ